MKEQLKIKLVKALIKIIKKDYIMDKCKGYAVGCPNCQGQILLGMLYEYLDILEWEQKEIMTTIKNYEKACVALAKKFSHIYSNGDYYFVGNDIGGICDFGDDLFLDSHDQVMVLELDPSVDEFYEAWNEWVEEDFNVNLENLIRYGVKQMKEINDKNNT